MRVALPPFVVALTMLVGPSAASAAEKFYDFNFGTPAGSTGGVFPNSTTNGGVGGIAVNDPSITSDGTGQSGWVYVADRASNRIQVFNSSAVFQFAIGRDVVASGGAGDTNERQTVMIGGAPTGGNFTLAFGASTTAGIAHNASAGDVDSALEAIASVGAGNVDVTGAAGGPYTVEFVGARASVDQAPMTADAGGLTGGTSPTVAVATAQDGASFEKCTQAPQCKTGATSTATRGNAGTFNLLRGVAIDQATGHLFVRESSPNLRVQEFTADGQFIRAFGWDVVASGPGNGPGNMLETCNAAADDVCQAASTAGGGAQDGQLGATTTSDSTGIAVAPSGSAVAGHVFVVDPGGASNRRVLEFQVPTGPSGAATFVDKFGGFAASTGGNNMPRHVAVDTRGVVYAGDSPSAATTGNIANIIRYDATSNTLKTPIIGSASDPRDVLGVGTVTALEFHQQTGHLYVGRNPSVGIMELDVSSNPESVDKSHIVLTNVAALNVAASGVGLNPVSGELFVATNDNGAAGSGTGSRVLVLDDNGVDPSPTSSIAPPTGVAATTVTLNGTINPNGPVGLATLYRWQVSKDGINWTDVTSNSSIGDGSTGVTVTNSITGLEANTFYRTRIVTSRAPAAGTSVSAELTFATDADLPKPDTIAAQHVSDTGAQLVGRLNPGGLTTSYWFEWGDDDYGNSIPVPVAQTTGSVAKIVVEELSGLSPESMYHFRLCARNALVAVAVCGADKSFTTRVQASPPAGARAYEMVSSPDKVLRRGGDVLVSGPNDYDRFMGGMVAPTGDSLLSNSFAGGADPNAGHGFSFKYTPEMRRRTQAGWVGGAVFNIPAAFAPTNSQALPAGVSTDLNTQAWNTSTPMFEPLRNNNSTHVMGDTGGPRGGGWYPFLSPGWFSGSYADYSNPRQTLVGDSGKAMVANQSAGAFYRDLSPSDGGARPDALTPSQNGGQALFLSTAADDWRPTDLVNECTGSTPGGNGTELISRVGTGVATDTIDAFTCVEGGPTSRRGAGLGAVSNTSPLASTRITAMSRDLKRVFFVSPDPDVGVPILGGGTTSCAPSVLDPAFGPAVGPLTECPPQLFVRQYDDDGNATVRWISRAEDALFNAPQRIGEVGGGVAFEGASTDGQVVYFRTNAPLTADDPNGNVSTTTGTAQASSWDLYRYELPGDNNTDPGGGELTRITAGPGDTAIPPVPPADPNTNCVANTATCGGTTNGRGGVVRFMSDDGERVYFVTVGLISGASNAPPAGGTTTVGGTSTSNITTRNLYLYDATKPGAAAYKFVARLPVATDTSAAVANLNACASFNWQSNGTPRGLADGFVALSSSSCVHGTSSGDAIVFETTGQLTSDDVDSAGDVYLYDANVDELVRLSAPPASSTPYPCLRPNIGGVQAASPTVASCNGDLGALTHERHLSLAPENFGLEGRRELNIAEDDDGRLKAVYFQSRLPLTEDDRGPDTFDVYEWRDGHLTLISPGDASRSALYVGNGLDGKDVFFWTEQRLSPWEIDPTDGDIYNARVNGGFPDPQPLPVVCGVLADRCQDSGGGSPLATEIQKPGPEGDEAETPKRMQLRVAAPTVAQRRLARRKGTIPLRVRMDGPGLVRASATARLRGKQRLVARGSLRFRKAGAATVRLRLSSAARSRIRSGRPLKLTTIVKATGAHERTLSVVIPGAER